MHPRNSHHPYAGSEFFAVDLVGGSGLSPYWLLLSNAPGNTPVVGGCSWLVCSFVIAVPACTASLTGSLSFQLSLPDNPVATGDIYAQYFGISRNSFISSDGVQIQIR